MINWPWVDRGGVHFSPADRGRLVQVDESYEGLQIDDIIIDVDFIDRITLKEGDGFTVRGRNYERNGGLDVRLDSDKLRVDATQDRRWLGFGVGDLFGRDERNSWLEITYPAGSKFGLVSADIGAGRLIAGSFDCEELHIDNSFGKIEISSVSCGSMKVNSASGDTSLTGVSVSGNAAVNNDFGSVKLNNVTAGGLTVGLSSGNVGVDGVTADTLEISNAFGRIDLKNIEVDSLELSLSSGDLVANSIKTLDLMVESHFGSVRFDRLDLGRFGQVDQRSGNVTLNLDKNEDDVSYELAATAGNVSVNENRKGNSASGRSAGAETSLRVNSDFGNITLVFLK